MFCLVDGNNFYVSCERVFNPKLIGKPVVVLSNNDGCVVSRSNEAKKIGIKMGEPLFKCRRLIDHYKVVCLSSNYTLYADMSERVVSVLREFSPDLEVYSIDESFILFTNKGLNYTQLGNKIRQKILAETGIPVGVGFGKSKTLAKISNHMAKRSHTGVFNIHDYNEEHVLKTVPVADIWGVGPGFSTRLRKKNIHFAYHIKHASLWLLKKICHVHGERMKLELMGIPAIKLVKENPAKKTIISSKSFARPLTDINDIKGALAENIIRAAEKLRAQNSKVLSFTILLLTNRFTDKIYKHYAQVTLPIPSSDTLYIAQYAMASLDKIYKTGLIYKKSGIILDQINSATTIQYSILNRSLQSHQQKQDKAMIAVDRINSKWGRHSICLATTHRPKKKWRMKQDKLSQKSTTNWADILEVK
jgi:DNA polymerase V